MTRNYLVFFFGIFVILIFSFAFCYVAIYSEVLISGIFALVGFLVTFAIAIIIGQASREEGGSLYISFFAVAVVTAIILVWFVTRAGTLLKVW